MSDTETFPTPGNNMTPCYPLLESLLAAKGLVLKGVYTVGDVAQIFDVKKRTIHDWIRQDRLRARRLPGRGRFLSQDLEDFLESSRAR